MTISNHLLHRGYTFCRIRLAVCVFVYNVLTFTSLDLESSSSSSWYTRKPVSFSVQLRISRSSGQGQVQVVGEKCLPVIEIDRQSCFYSLIMFTTDTLQLEIGCFIRWNSATLINVLSEKKNCSFTVEL